MNKICFYCSLQFPEDADFCPACGRFLEKNVPIRVVHVTQLDILREQLKEKDDLIRSLILTQSLATRGASPTR